MNRQRSDGATRLPEVLVGMLWLCIAAALTACAWATSDRAERGDLAELRRIVAAVNSDWVLAMQARDTHRAAQAYAEDAIFVTRDGAILTGRNAIERAAAERLANGSSLLDGRLDDDGLEPAGALVYEWGHSTLHWKRPDGEIRLTEGRFLTVWRRGGAGKWEIVRNLTL